MKGTISNLMEECKGIPKKWARRFPSHAQDFMGEAKLAIVIAIKKYGKDVDVSLARTIVGRRCEDYVSSIPTITIPRTTARRLASQGEESLVHTCEYLEDAHGRAVRHFDTTDTVKTICLRELDVKVLTMRSDGKTYQEIGDALGYHKSYIGQIIKRLRRKFNDTKCVC